MHWFCLVCTHPSVFLLHSISEILKWQYFLGSLNYFASPRMNDNSSRWYLLAGLAWCDADLPISAGRAHNAGGHAAFGAFGSSAEGSGKALGTDPQNATLRKQFNVLGFVKANQNEPCQAALL